MYNMACYSALRQPLRPPVPLDTSITYHLKNNCQALPGPSVWLFVPRK